MAIPKYIKEQIQKDPDIKKISTNAGGISDQDVKELLALLKQSRQIEELDLYGNGVGNDGAVFLVENMPTTIKRVNLSSNNVNDEGLTRIVQVINRRNIQHFELDLDANNISDKGLVPEVFLLPQRDVYLSFYRNNGISEGRMEELEDAFRKTEINKQPLIINDDFDECPKITGLNFAGVFANGKKGVAKTTESVTDIEKLLEQKGFTEDVQKLFYEIEQMAQKYSCDKRVLLQFCEKPKIDRFVKV